MVLELFLRVRANLKAPPLRGCGERNYMARFFLTNLTGSILKKILIVAACALAFAWAQTSALAQRPVVHTGGGVHPCGGGGPTGGGRMGTPPVEPLSRQPSSTGPVCDLPDDLGT